MIAESPQGKHCQEHRSLSANQWMLRADPPNSTGDWKAGPKLERARRVQPDWLPLRRHLDHISNIIDGSKMLLTTYDEDARPVTTRETWDRAVHFLASYSRQVWDKFSIKVDAPQILPGPDQSIDIHWRQPAYEMLINIPVNANEIPTYYGDDKLGNTISGSVASTQNRGLLLWLARQK